MARRPTRPQVEPAATLGPLRLIWRAAARYPGYIAAALLALAVTAAATLAIPAGFRLIIDRGFVAGTNPVEIARWFRYLGLIVAVLAIGTAFRFYFVSWLGERVVADIRAAVHTNLLRLSPAFFEENSPAEIASRMTADTGQIEQVVGTTISVALRNSIMSVGGIAYLFYLAPQLVVLLLIAVPMVLVPIIVFGRRVRKLSRESQDRVAVVGALTAEVLGAMKIVQAFNQERREEARFADAVENTFNTAKQRIALRAVMTAVTIAVIFGSITALMWRGAVQVSEGVLSGGTIAAFVLTGVMVAGALGSLAEVYGDLLRGAGAASRLDELLHEQPGIA
ncbi:MAG: ABC transporter transmembrane domain-containing protein, partial [Croceibacterium sp.]